MEIKAKDFRIGNYYLDEENNMTQMSGYALWQFSIKENLGQMEEVKRFFRPVLLPEEMILKFGFIKEEKKGSQGFGHYYSIWIQDYKYSFSFATFRNDWSFYVEYTDSPFEEDEGKKYPVSVGIKFVHQLQNLFDGLEQEELIFKP